MRLGFNLLGIAVWVILILYLVFTIQNIRKRHLRMIVQDRKRFEGKTLAVDLVEIIVLLVAAVFMIKVTFFDNPDLSDQQAISSTTEYRPLILTTGTGKSYYVTASSAKKTRPVQSYTFYSDGNKYTVDSHYATVVTDSKTTTVNAAMIPFNKRSLQKADSRYQRAFVAVYTATYRNNWRNGLGLHAGRLATRYYYLRVPDATFVREK
jgi:hypothetical protein